MGICWIIDNTGNAAGGSRISPRRFKRVPITPCLCVGVIIFLVDTCRLHQFSFDYFLYIVNFTPLTFHILYSVNFTA